MHKFFIIAESACTPMDHKYTWQTVNWAIYETTYTALPTSTHSCSQFYGLFADRIPLNSPDCKKNKTQCLYRYLTKYSVRTLSKWLYPITAINATCIEPSLMILFQYKHMQHKKSLYDYIQTHMCCISIPIICDQPNEKKKNAATSQIIMSPKEQEWTTLQGHPSFHHHHKVDLRQGQPKGSLFDSYYTKV